MGMTVYLLDEDAERLSNIHGHFLSPNLTIGSFKPTGRGMIHHDVTVAVNPPDNGFNDWKQISRINVRIDM
jgi:hypothetical protein